MLLSLKTPSQNQELCLNTWSSSSGKTKNLALKQAGSRPYNTAEGMQPAKKETTTAKQGLQHRATWCFNSNGAAAVRRYTHTHIVHEH
jgi:hypothetical protein